ncbi:MAG: hypothetical protein IJ545_08050 [Alphaproteobacteria bacterium]|nr:hypothetical protein [Alphaproteobacteria bacterium]
MTKFKTLLSILLICAITSNCGLFYNNSPEGEVSSNEPRFTNAGKIDLKVSKIDVVSEFTPSFRRPNVEHLLPISIEKTARIWARDRLEAVDYSSTKQAHVIIKDASVTEELQPAENLFDRDQIKYHATLYIVVRITDTNSLSSAGTEVEAWRELTIPASTDIEDKEQYWNKMVYDLFNDFNQRMDYNIHKYLNMYIANDTTVTNY